MKFFEVMSLAFDWGNRVKTFVTQTQRYKDQVDTLIGQWNAVPTTAKDAISAYLVANGGEATEIDDMVKIATDISTSLGTVITSLVSGSASTI